MAKAEGPIWFSQSLMAAARSSLAVRHGHSSEPDQAQPQRFTVTASLLLNGDMTLMQYHTQYSSGDLFALRTRWNKPASLVWLHCIALTMSNQAVRLHSISQTLVDLYQCHQWVDFLP